MLYMDSEVPMFNCREDCFALVTQLLENQSNRKEIEKRFSNTTLDQFEDIPVMKKVVLALSTLASESPKRVDTVHKLPLWYRRLKLRVRVQHMDNSIYRQVIEIYREVVGNTKCPIIVRTILFIDIIGWTLYRVFLDGIVKIRKGVDQMRVLVRR